jgi:curli biogenesis system outer membrane secretion channel CsgG
MRKITVLITLLAVSLFFGCSGHININPNDFKVSVPHKMRIPEICKAQYSSSRPRVSVIKFNNNSTFGKASVENKNSSKSAEAGIGIVTTDSVKGIGAVAKSSSSSQKTNRNIDSKISKSLASIVESIVINGGGAELFTREDFEKINNEMKFQDSGLVNEDTLVDFGKTAGVQYIITGSLDNVEQHYQKGDGALAGAGKLTAKVSKNSNLQLLGIGASLIGGLISKPGMTIKTIVTVRILEVSSSKIVFSKTFEGKNFIGQIEKPTYDQIIGGIKAAVKKSLTKHTREINSYFALKAYITKIKSNGSDLIARISVGSNKQVSIGNEFIVYSLEENKDQIKGTNSCDLIDTGMRLEVTNQISPDSSWGFVKNGKIGDIKINQLLKGD